MSSRIDSRDVYTHAVGALYDEADTSRNPLSRDLLLDLVAEAGIGRDALVLDVGCANGGVSRNLLARTGCRIEGVELLDFLVEMGNRENEEMGVDRFAIRQGTITDLPFADEQFDFVFCNDVIGLVDDLPRAVAECRRVLKPHSKILFYASFATDRMDEREARELNDSLGGARDGLSLARAARCIEENFTLLRKIVIGSQFTQNSVEAARDESEATKSLLKVARLLTWPDHYIERHGERTYRIVLAEAQWVVCILLGKLQPTVFIAQAT